MARPSLVARVRASSADLTSHTLDEQSATRHLRRSVAAVRGFLLVPFVIALTLPACSLKPSAVTPSIVGVVRSSLTDLDVTSVVTLEDGTTFDMAGAKPLLGGRPFQGELLVAGGSGNDRWYYALPTSKDQPFDSVNCRYTITASDIWEEPDAVVFGFGLRLSKGDVYVRPEPLREMYARGLFCVSEAGEVTKALSYEPH